MTEEQQKISEPRNFKNTNIRFSIRMIYILPPIDTVELIDSLVKAGYTRIAPPTPSGRQRGVQFSFTGPIARKGDVILDVNDERGILGVASPLPASAIQGFNEVLQLIKANLKVDPEIMAGFYELIGQCEVESKINPITKFGQISEKIKIMEEFSKVIGKDASLFSLRLVPKGEIPNQAEWFDITIEPHLVHPTSIYNISVVYRSLDKSKVQKFTEEFFAKVTEILDVIENL